MHRRRDSATMEPARSSSRGLSTAKIMESTAEGITTTCSIPLNYGKKTASKLSNGPPPLRIATPKAAHCAVRRTTEELIDRPSTKAKRAVRVIHFSASCGCAFLRNQV